MTLRSRLERAGRSQTSPNSTLSVRSTSLGAKDRSASRAADDEAGGLDMNIPPYHEWLDHGPAWPIKLPGGRAPHCDRKPPSALRRVPPLAAFSRSVSAPPSFPPPPRSGPETAAW